jgi:rod shape determining protein RodA
MIASAISRPGERDRWIVKFGDIDWMLCGLLCVIAGAGGLMLYSIDGSKWTPWAADHLIRFGIFFLMMIVLALVDLRAWFFLAYPIYAVGLVMLLGVELAGDVSLGAKRWLAVGMLKFQPSEIMKIGLVLGLARFYHSTSAEDARLSWKLIIPLGMIGLPALLVAHQPDLGTAILLSCTGLSVMFMAGLSLRLIALGMAAFAVAAVPAYMFVLHDYQKERLTTFLHPETDPSGAGYHTLQAKIALGSGGLLGKGYGLGSQSSLNFLPEKQTDFIFASLAEEFGFVGCFSILMLYAAVVAISLRIASISHSHFGRLAGAGVTSTFMVYVLINAAMVMGMAPVVGVPMPLLSYGGTVMLSVMAGFGILQSIKVHRYAEVTSGQGTLL